MSTLRKIEGFVDNRNLESYDAIDHKHRGIYLWSDTGNGQYPHSPAVLIVSSDGQPPRYFTQEEVKAILREINEKLNGMVDFANSYYTNEAAATTFTVIRSAKAHIEGVAAKHGITDL